MLFQIIALLIIVLIFTLLAVFIKNIGWLLINSFIGFLALILTRIFLPGLDINIWSVLITAVGGIPGYFIVIIFHLLGIAF